MENCFRPLLGFLISKWPEGGQSVEVTWFSSPTGVPYFKIINRGNARRLADLGFRPLLGFLISKCLCALTTHTPAASFRPLLGFLISKLAELPEDKRLEFQFSSPTGVPYFKMSKLLEY